MRRPRALKPAEIDSQSQSGQNQEVAPVAVLIGIGARRLPQQCCYGDRQQGVQGEPLRAENAGATRNQQIRDAQDRRAYELRPDWGLRTRAPMAWEKNATAK
jgi:hypothetical protein